MTDTIATQGKRHLARNWAIWRAHRVSGIRPADIARDFGIHPTRIRQIIAQYDNLAEKMLNCSINLPVSDALRDGLLGVEFVFTHEVRLDADDDTWLWVNPAPYYTHEWRDGKRTVTRKQGGHAKDEHVVYRVARETDEE